MLFYIIIIRNYFRTKELYPPFAIIAKQFEKQKTHL